MAEATALWELLRQTADPAPFRFERLARASKWVPLLRAKPIELERLRGMTALARSAGRPARFGFAKFLDIVDAERKGASARTSVR